MFLWRAAKQAATAHAAHHFPAHGILHIRHAVRKPCRNGGDDLIRRLRVRASRDGRGDGEDPLSPVARASSDASRTRSRS